jgi:ATP-dependent phosphoenolpyruvate carboxykinase
LFRLRDGLRGELGFRWPRAYWAMGEAGLARLMRRGPRRPIRMTRRLLTAALDGSLANAKFKAYAYFGFAFPSNVPGVEPHIITPFEVRQDKVDFVATAKK